MTRRPPPETSVAARAGLRGRRRCLRPTPQDASRGAGRPGRLRHARRGRFARGGRRPGLRGERLAGRRLRPSRRGTRASPRSLVPVTTVTVARAREDQPRSSRRTRCATTASTRSPRSTRRSRCTTRSRPGRPTAGEFTITVTGEGQDDVPLDDVQPRDPGGRSAAPSVRGRRRRRLEHPQDDRSRRRPRRRQRRRRRRAASPATRCGAPGRARDELARHRRRARQRRAVLPGRRQRRRDRPWRAACRRCSAAAPTSGCSPTPTRAVDAARLSPSSTASRSTVDRADEPRGVRTI